MERVRELMMASDDPMGVTVDQHDERDLLVVRLATMETHLRCVAPDDPGVGGSGGCSAHVEESGADLFDHATQKSFVRPILTQPDDSDGHAPTMPRPTASDSTMPGSGSQRVSRVGPPPGRSKIHTASLPR